MKKVTGLFLLIVLLMNILGYYAAMLGWEFESGLSMVQNLDEGRYADTETTTLKIPLALPYAPETEFQRVDRSFEYKGEFYRTVMEKISHDTLYVVVIPDHQRDQIHNAMADLVKTFSDDSATDNNSGTKHPSLELIKEFIRSDVGLTEHSTGWQRLISYHFYNVSTGAFPPSSILQPPEHSA